MSSSTFQVDTVVDHFYYSQYLNWATGRCCRMTAVKCLWINCDEFNEFHSTAPCLSNVSDVFEIVHLIRSVSKAASVSVFRWKKERGEPTLMDPLERVCITSLLQHYCISPICFQVSGGLLSLLKAHIRSGQLDELQEPHCRNQLRQQPCINYSFSNIMASHFCSSHYNSLVSVTYLGVLENL